MSANRRDYAPSRSYDSHNDRKDMYDERPRSPQQHHDRRGPRIHHDRSRTPPRGPRHQDTNNRSSRQWRDRDDRDGQQHRRGRSRSRSPRHQYQYRNRDHEDYRSPPRRGREQQQQSRSRSRSQYRGGREHSHERGGGFERRTLLKGPPSRDLIMEGLPGALDEDDVGILHPPRIRKQLKENYSLDGLEDIRVIRDRNTKISREFGFLQFTSVDSSQDFLRAYGPEITLHGLDDNSRAESYIVRIANSRQPDDEWKCLKCKFSNFSTRAECFRCKEPRSGRGMASRLAPNKPSDFENSGDQDVATAGMTSQFLLFRGLDGSVTESMLAKGATKLYKSSPIDAANSGKGRAATSKVVSTTSDSSLGAKPDCIARALLVRDRRTDESWRFGFVEFKTVDDAAAALTKYNAQERFTIASKPVMASFIHAGVFVPAWNYDSSRARFTIGLLANPSTRLAYWDDEAYASELIVQSEPDSEAKTESQASKTHYPDEASKPSKKRKGGDGGGEVGSAPPDSKKTAPAHLQFWSNRHAELHGISSSAEASSEVPHATSKEDPSARSRPKSTPDEVTVSTQSFADHKRNCCLLCSRQFKSAAEVNKHERLSQLHRDNLANEEVRIKALRRLALVAGQSFRTNGELSNSNEDSFSAGYRDRARERRQAFNQPAQPAPQVHPASQFQQQGSGATKGNRRASKDDEEEEDEEKYSKSSPSTTSKGAALLGKMGWSAGSGLGAQGEGTRAALTTEVYAAGVGLGAAGGKLGDAAEEAGRNTRGEYAGFVGKVKDKAKERFENMR